MLDLSRKVERKTLRPHQKSAIEQLRSSIRSGKRKTVLMMPTGAGKTLTAAKIIESATDKGNQVLFTVPRISLIDQTVAEFEREGIFSIGVQQANHPRRMDSAMVQIGTVHTLLRRLESLPLNPGLVLVDEAHEDNKVIHQMMDKWPRTPFIGLTATPWRTGMGLVWQDLIIPVTIGSLIEYGYLSQFKVYAPHVPDLKGVRSSMGDYAEAGLEEVMGEAKIVGGIVETWLERGENRPTLVFCVNCNHAKAVHNQFERAGIASAYVDHKTDVVERGIIERRFRAGEIKVACSVRTLTTGVDWPVSCIVDAAPTKSEMLHVQKIGRGLRVNEGTEDLIILDHAGNSLRLGLVTDIHHDTLCTKTKPEPEPSERKERGERLPKPCHVCEILFTGLTCPSCGAERKPGHGVESAEGELVELTPKKPVSRDDKQTFWSMALYVDQARGKGGRLAKGLYKGKFGVWPKGLVDQPRRPDASFYNYEKSRRIAYAKRMEKQREKVSA
jgi:DNA repair protein RadD